MKWAFNGMMITDNANTGVFMDGYQMIEAGGDIKLTYLADSARFDFDKNDTATYHYSERGYAPCPLYGSKFQGNAWCNAGNRFRG